VITVQKALEESSDVGAAKMALKLGPDKFYGYMRAFGFGQRTGIELPSETRGLLRPPKKWGSTSILSLAIGQEVGVTPIQLVTMVSTIANGGVYMPPHILLQSTDEIKGDARLRPEPFRAAYQLPETLPEGSHRVIREITSAKMRAMMEGIVLEGTGKPAQLNGYSAAGKTGTAEKIDPATHTYSHTKLVASFAGFAPVSDPAISIAVVIDTPTVGSAYGTTAAAPVFRELAQEVLEYLGVPHDQPLKTPQQMMETAKSVQPDDVPDEEVADMGAMFDQINSLPEDDPLRQPQTAAAMEQNVVADERATAVARAQPPPEHGLLGLPKEMLAAFHANGNTTSVMPASGAEMQGAGVSRAESRARAHDDGAVVVDAGNRVAVPEFRGAALRTVVEHAAGLGLRVETLGSGLAQDQMPAAGTMVPPGTEIVVRFAR
jgi:cell division protein FtsI (penicillin-binding protein 3)